MSRIKSAIDAPYYDYTVVILNVATYIIYTWGFYAVCSTLEDLREPKYMGQIDIDTPCFYIFYLV